MASKKRSILKFKQWQQDSKLHIAQPSDEKHHCHCCDSEFVGNYCPQCGQKVGNKRITWASIRTGVMELWGMGNRSLPYTLWQLLLRPGYLIGDYINGRRQVSFPPIKMLVFVALFVYIVTSLLSNGEASESPGEDFMMMDYAINFFEKHYDVGVMFVFSMLIIPTYFIFRFAPRNDHHTLPEGFFIQVFNSTIALVLILIITVFNSLFSLLNPENFVNSFLIDVLLIILVLAFVIYRSYHQLFGYRHWATLWRVIVVCVSAVLTLGAIIVMDFMTTIINNGNYDRALKNLFYRFIPYLLTAVAIVSVSYFISRQTAKRRKPIDK